jgi:hypothetical protein
MVECGVEGGGKAEGAGGDAEDGEEAVVARGLAAGDACVGAGKAVATVGGGWAR